MATSDARKHTVPEGADAPDGPADLAALSLSIRDIIQVANTTARADLVTALTDAGLAPSPTNPLYVHRTDAAPGRELEYTTDGSTWQWVTASRSGAQPMDSGYIAGGWGSVTANGGIRSTPVTFTAGRFTVAPVVVITPGSTRLTCAAINVTATGFTLQTNNWTSADSAAAVSMGWAAFGREA